MYQLVDGDRTARAIYSGGWRPATSSIEVTEKATGKALFDAGVATRDDVAAAAESAFAAQPAWAATLPQDRAAILYRAADLIQRHAEEITWWVQRETGGTAMKAGFEIFNASTELRQAAALCLAADGHTLPSTVPGRTNFARRVPLGVVGIITPWNFPMLLAMRALAPALALGNAVLFKPDVNTPVTGGVLLARIFEDAGLPADVLHMLPGDGVTGAAVVEAPQVRMISFTGSTATGRLVGETAGRLLKKVQLELGGNNAFIVLDDADVPAAAKAGAWGAFFHQGQVCMAASRHLVHRSVADDYIEALAAEASRLKVGDPTDPSVHIGPIINERQLAKVSDIVDSTVAAGARTVTGGTASAPFYRPTVLSEVTPGMPAFEEEIFGPVAPVVVFDSEEEAVELANRTEYGLTAGIYTGSTARGLAVAGRLRTGMVHIGDQTINDEPHIPLGGTGSSGTGGRFGGVANVEEFTEWRWFTVQEQQTGLPY
ncbi:aldehyde dehydrogenase family protein [Kutzneria sp. NPDC051319]|uniref:aldehyde dehydrogenase family protein n=1 Tax=Kutzneria sp. NPDC051319 TaxID=3155047 RepID=UPI003416B0B7